MAVRVYDQIFDQAVDAVVRTYKQNIAGIDHKFSDTEALDGFWRAKSQNGFVEYLEQIIDRSSICYVFLPGGSCYSSHSEHTDFGKAREEASRIALMNSLFDEHPMRKITSAHIQQVVNELRTKPETFGRTNVFEGCAAVMEFMEGRSMLELNELHTNLHLLQWAGRSQDSDFSSRSQYLEYARSLQVDESLRAELALGLVEREQEMCGFVEHELTIAQEELQKCRSSQSELRFPFEKEHICQLALQHEELEYGGEQLAPISDFA